jgi:hypothetical protein
LPTFPVKVPRKVTEKSHRKSKILKKIYNLIGHAEGGKKPISHPYPTHYDEII